MNTLPRRIMPLLLCLVLLAALFPAAPALGEEANLLKNPGFEALDEESLPLEWFTDAYIRRDGFTVYASTGISAQEGQSAAVITNIGANDSRFGQAVAVEPESLYRLSGYVRAADVEDTGLGANLSVDGVYAFSDSIFDTQGQWQYVETYGETGPDQHEVIVYARLGGYSGESVGTAEFDNLSLVKVDALPDNAIAHLWFQNPATTDVMDVDATDTEAAPAWPYLVWLGLLYGLIAFLLTRHVMAQKPKLLFEAEKLPIFLLAGLALGLVVRLVIALHVSGYPVDVNCFVSWGGTMAREGAGNFYQATNFCDYPPGYVYALGFSSWLGRFLPGTVLPSFVFKLIPMVADLGLAWLLYAFARKEGGMGKEQAGLMSLLVSLHPALILNSAAWCQVDSVLCLLLMAAVLTAMRRQWAWTLPLYVLSVLVKPQALMMGPLGLAAIIWAWVHTPKDRKPMLIGVGASLAVLAVVLVPFSVNQPWNWVIDLYMRTLASYPYATLNTANLYYLFAANWAGVGDAAHTLAPLVMGLLAAGVALLHWWKRGGRKLPWLDAAVHGAFALAFCLLAVVGTSWSLLGSLAIGWVLVLVILLFIRGGHLRHLPMLAWLMFLLLYVLGTKMHERYLLPAVLFFAMDVVVRRDRRTLWLMVLTGITLFINAGIVLDNGIRLGASLGHLNDDTLRLNVILSVLNVSTVPLALWVAFSAINAPDQRLPLAPIRQVDAVDAATTTRAAAWDRKDVLLVLAVTLAYAVLAFVNLGNPKAPQTAWKSASPQDEVVFDLGESRSDVRMLYYGQVSYEDFQLSVSEDGGSWSQPVYAEMAEGQCFRWKYATLYTVGQGGERKYENTPRVLSGRYVRLRADQVGLVLNEVIFRDEAGNVLPATIHDSLGGMLGFSNPNSFLDEQDTLSGEPGWYNGTYFDEIYHARTAFEHLQGTVPYETSHPPLGKIFISWGIALFGMTPFGWRFAGALAGVLMLPVLYALGKRLTGNRWMGFGAMVLMALDTMHFTQTRIATIDSFPVLFILLSYWMMLRFMQRDVLHTSMRKLLPDLALSGLFMGCGIASKWTGVYAGAGLAILFFWKIIGTLRQQSLHQPLTAPGADASQQPGKHPLIPLCIWAILGWCVVFFVLVPVVIYLLSYIPYFAYDMDRIPSIGAFIKRVADAQLHMYNYHAKPGLGMDHFFYSPWYEWMLNERPMWYAMDAYKVPGYSYSIVAFGNPAVWLMGLVGFGATAWIWARRHRYVKAGTDRLIHLQASDSEMATGYVLIATLTQILPWVLVPRGTYIYHYFATVPFLILATMLLMVRIIRRQKQVGYWLFGAFLVVSLALFVAFFPYASGATVSTAWLDTMKQFLKLYY